MCLVLFDLRFIFENVLIGVKTLGTKQTIIIHSVIRIRTITGFVYLTPFSNPLTTVSCLAYNDAVFIVLSLVSSVSKNNMTNY